MSSAVSRSSPRWAARLVTFAVMVLSAFSLPAAAATNTEATQKAIQFLSADVANWTTHENCIACHRQGAAVFGLSSAKANGYNMAQAATNGRTLQQNLDAITARIKTDQLPSGHWLYQGSSFPNSKTGWASFGLAGFDQYVSTQYSSALVMAANWALGMQQSSGRWNEDHSGTPVNHGNVPITARYIVALAQAKQRVDPAKAAQYQAAIDKAAAYLRANINTATTGVFDDGMPYTFQKSWAIVGLKAAGPGANGVNTTTINTLANQLIAMPSVSGKGWGRLPTDASDDFATGIAVYSLCLAGKEPASNARLFNAIEWLKTKQAADGGWEPASPARDIPTTFASLGLACFGDFSVEVSVVGEDTKMFSIPNLEPKETTYTLKVKNHGYQADTYTLSTAGGLPGWTATLSRPTVFLASGAESTVTVTVRAPANLLPSLLSEVTVTAASGGAAGVSASARVRTYTPPEPPVTGVATTTTILSPAANASVTIGNQATLSARVRNASTNAVVTGSKKGVVTFFVAGVAIGADDDADGDGVFSLNWTIATDTWSATGAQDYRAVYSGVTLQPASPNLLGSTAAQTLVINPYPYTAPEVIMGNQPAFLRETTLNAWGFVKPATNGAFITYAAFIVNGGAPVVVNPELSGGLVYVPVELVEGPNIIQLTGRDNLGGVTTKQINLTVDRVAPVITIQSPVSGQVVGGLVDVISQIDEQTPTRVETQWVNTTLLEFGTGSVTHPVSLPNFGEQGILVRATDSAGNVTEAVVHVFVDSGSPTVTTDTADGATFGPRANNSLPYVIRVSSVSATTVKLGSQQFQLPRGGGEIQTSVTLASGVNTLTIDATNEAGRTTRVTRTVRYDTQAPTATLVTPAPGGTVGGVVTLTARVTDALSGIKNVAFTRDGSGIRAGTLQSNGTWTASLDTHELLDGTHTVDVWMTDSVDNFVIQSFSFTVKNN
ncbi:ABC transporter substrate-binding protein [Corallococcus exiguus]|uniref:Ig-like domain-containing protein n=1 Tax=Corallococcus TaxID=83461 RepID=UPI000F89CFEC|nr:MULTISPECIES: Ig-like domain-containing protein [Corallococcus]NRD58219.1 ABC transporter substrate-binding protein [Corallococcus exiguus]NRD65237.1 ABC transporter substrate-binding protein [Corallococcus exiguus]RUO87874.1 ABC transporter substrate-binding protein [Corallococcus sp. AB018]